MYVKTIVVGALATNCYLVGCEKTKKAALIDPGDDGEKILAAVKQSGFQVDYIINTHGHVDHIGANKNVKEATGAQLLIHKDDADFLTNPSKNLSGLMAKQNTGPAADRLLDDGDKINIGNTVTLEVLHTPGHTPGGICLKGEDVIFTGDTVFAGSIGRTDLPGGSYTTIINSIREKLMALEGDFTLYPGHGPASTLREEKVSNPFLR
ncbi:MAG: MBL fold metallo-hydrolase [Thermoanaerobacteraceae bacterium]|nr:MBL fold metallo-hydrolase [Thermoanaerobacteraceae bacterium]